jgi:MscS family membrane protein
MLMADKPFRVGERIVAVGYDGVVEEIGLRSTRIRLLTGHQVTIPNDTLACNDVENVGRRPYIRRASNIHIPLDTPREKIEIAVRIIRHALENHEGMPEDMPPRVFFNEFNDDSFNIRVMYWYQPAEYWDYLAFSERLNLEIMRAFEDQQIGFSLPMRVAHATFDDQEEPIDVRMVDPHKA